MVNYSGNSSQNKMAASLRYLRICFCGLGLESVFAAGMPRYKPGRMRVPSLEAEAEALQQRIRELRDRSETTPTATPSSSSELSSVKSSRWPPLARRTTSSASNSLSMSPGDLCAPNNDQTSHSPSAQILMPTVSKATDRTHIIPGEPEQVDKILSTLRKAGMQNCERAYRLLTNNVEQWIRAMKKQRLLDASRSVPYPLPKAYTLLDRLYGTSTSMGLDKAREVFVSSGVSTIINELKQARLISGADMSADLRTLFFDAEILLESMRVFFELRHLLTTAIRSNRSAKERANLSDKLLDLLMSDSTESATSSHQRKFLIAVQMITETNLHTAFDFDTVINKNIRALAAEDKSLRKLLETKLKIHKNWEKNDPAVIDAVIFSETRKQLQAAFNAAERLESVL